MALAQVQCRSWRLPNNGHQGSVEEGAEICTKRRLELERSTACPRCKRVLRGSTAVVGSCCRGWASIEPSCGYMHSSLESPLFLISAFRILAAQFALVLASAIFDEEICSE